MAETRIDLATWSRADRFHFFRGFERPHYAITARCDVTHLVTHAKPRGVSAYRACLWAIGMGVHAVPELRLRFRNEEVVQHDRVKLSMTVPRDDGSFNYAYVAHDQDFARFDQDAAAEITRAKTEGQDPNPPGQDGVVFLSAMPWLDYTALDNAMPDADDCIPRVSWGKFTETGGGWSMAMTLQAHHALVDGAHMAAYFDAVGAALAQV